MNISDKHAFLILAHKQDFTFETLLRLLDDERNDLYIHMDSKNTCYDPARVSNIVKHSHVFHVERTSIAWGGYSMVHAELLLLRAACDRGQYRYYHLISGEDLPLKTPSEMHCYFDKHDGTEFVTHTSFDGLHERMCYRYPLQEYVGRPGSRKLLGKMQRFLLLTQKALHLETNHGIPFEKGSQWFSITDVFARYILDNASWIRKTFRFSCCPDESAIQTLTLYSPKGELPRLQVTPSASIRLIPWVNNLPRVLRSDDFEMLAASGKLFARKFCSNVDCEIIEHWGSYMQDKMTR